MWDKEFVPVDELSLVQSQMARPMSDDDAMSVITNISDDDSPGIESAISRRPCDGDLHARPKNGKNLL
jgi:hypothetical protein